MGDRIIKDVAARSLILEGAEKLYDAVKTTMGPRGNNVIISKGNPIITHDGVTVAKNINITEEGLKAGADLIKEAASKMNDVAGDGTTTVTVLTYHILNEASKLIAAGHSPMELRKQLEAAAEAILPLIKGEDISTNQDRLAEVAFISSGDKELGAMISDVIFEIGQSGVVMVEPSPEIQTRKIIEDGFVFDRGFQSPYFVTNPTTGEAIYDDALILVCGQRLSGVQDILPILEKMHGEKKTELVIFAEEFGPELLGNLVLNKIKGVFNTVAVQIPGYRKELLRDISTITGATTFGPDTGVSLDAFEMGHLGKAGRVSVNQEQTTVVQGGGDPKVLDNLIAEIDAKLKDGPDESQERRKAALQGKVAIIQVGGSTETEIEEKKFRVDDAVNAVKAAMEDGVVDGGGVTLLTISKTLAPDTPGAVVLKAALEQPFRILLQNAGIRPDAYIDQLKPGEGVNVSTGEVVNLKKNGIIDPAAVTKKAVQNAVSIAGTALTVGALVVKEEEKKDETPSGLPIN